MRRFLKAKRILTTLVLFIFLFCLFPIKAAYADESQPSESAGDNDFITVPNPVEGLLDPAPANPPASDARAFLIYDPLSDTMLIGNEYDTPREPASITQIMTVLLALEELQLSDEITITKEMYETIPDDYVRIGFNEGEVVTVEQCLYACILKSANDAAMALAIHISGNVDDFVAKMNTRAQELGCTNTHFTNPYGLSDFEHKTTCHDMCLILKEALKHPDYTQISTTTSYTMEPTNKYNDRRVLNNGNRYISTPSLAYEYYIGGKTGYTAAAGYTIIAGAEKEGKRLIGILMGAYDAETRYSNLISLLEYCFMNYTTTKIEASELTDVQAATIEQINLGLQNTNLAIVETQLSLLEYYTIAVSKANQGYSNSIDLSEVVIDPLENNQVFILPIYRTFSGETSYKIGYLTLRISDPSLEIQEETGNKEDPKASTKKIIMVVVISIVLVSIVVLALVLFFKLTRKRKFLKNHKNPRVL